MVMTIPTVITRNYDNDNVAPRCLAVTLSLRRHQYNKLAFSGLSNQKLSEMNQK